VRRRHILKRNPELGPGLGLPKIHAEQLCHAVDLAADAVPVQAQVLGGGVPAAMGGKPGPKDPKLWVPAFRVQFQDRGQEARGQLGTGVAAQQAGHRPGQLLFPEALPVGDDTRAERTGAPVGSSQAGQPGWFTHHQAPAQLLHLGEQGIVHFQPGHGRETVLRELHHLGIEQPPPLKKLPHGPVRRGGGRSFRPYPLDDPDRPWPGCGNALGQQVLKAVQLPAVASGKALRVQQHRCGQLAGGQGAAGPLPDQQFQQAHHR
jgi:hypothetical protein